MPTKKQLQEKNENFEDKLVKCIFIIETLERIKEEYKNENTELTELKEQLQDANTELYMENKELKEKIEKLRNNIKIWSEDYVIE